MQSESLNLDLTADQFAVIRDTFLKSYQVLREYFAEIPRWNPLKPPPIPTGFWHTFAKSENLRNALADAGILGAEYGCDRARRLVRRPVIREAQILIVVDTPEQKTTGERVFPWTDEGELVLREMQRLGILQVLPESASVLDVGTGAGTIAIAIKKLRPDVHVTALDISQRAIQTARFNALLNDVEGPLEFIESDLFSKLEKTTKFDLIVADPPFALTPQGISEYQNSSGGEHGDKVVERVIAEAGEYLCDGGRFLLLTYSLGTAPLRGQFLPERLRIEQAFKKSAAFSRLAVGENRMKAIRHLENEKVMRFGTEKCTESPMPLQYWSLRACDPAYLSYQQGSRTPEDMIANFGMFREFLDCRVGEGWTHLYYLFVEHYVVPIEFR